MGTENNLRETAPGRSPAISGKSGNCFPIPLFTAFRNGLSPKECVKGMPSNGLAIAQAANAAQAARACEANDRMRYTRGAGRRAGIPAGQHVTQHCEEISVK
jgi:hypothetical protein